MQRIFRLSLVGLSCALAVGEPLSASAQSVACFFVGTVTSISATGYGANSDLLTATLHGQGSDGSVDHTFRIGDFGLGPVTTIAKVDLIVTAFQHRTPLTITYYPNSLENPDVAHIINVSRPPVLTVKRCGPG